MATRVIIGAEIAKLCHKGTINGQLPKLANGDIAEATVSAGIAKWEGLSSGGLFRFNKRHLVVEGVWGGTPTIVNEDNTASVVRTTPTTFPFKLHPGEALMFSTGSDVGIVVREDITKVI